jgi:hypothetical protein
MNIGIVVSTYSAADPNGVVPRIRRTTFTSPVSMRMPTMPAVASEKAIGTPRRSATTITRKGR